MDQYPTYLKGLWGFRCENKIQTGLFRIIFVMLLIVENHGDYIQIQPTSGSQVVSRDEPEGCLCFQTAVVHPIEGKL